MLKLRSRGSSVGLVTGGGVSSPDRNKRFFCTYFITSTPTLGPTHCPTQWVLGGLPCVNLTDEIYYGIQTRC
jgi:hypothetical protein